MIPSKQLKTNDINSMHKNAKLRNEWITNAFL